MIGFLLFLAFLVGGWALVLLGLAGVVLYLAAGAVVLSPIFLWCYVREVRADRRKARQLQEGQS